MVHKPDERSRPAAVWVLPHVERRDGEVLVRREEGLLEIRNRPAEAAVAEPEDPIEPARPSLALQEDAELGRRPIGEEGRRGGGDGAQRVGVVFGERRQDARRAGELDDGDRRARVAAQKVQRNLTSELVADRSIAGARTHAGAPVEDDRHPGEVRPRHAHRRTGEGDAHEGEHEELEEKKGLQALPDPGRPRPRLAGKAVPKEEVGDLLAAAPRAQEVEEKDGSPGEKEIEGRGGDERHWRTPPARRRSWISLSREGPSGRGSTGCGGRRRRPSSRRGRAPGGARTGRGFPSPDDEVHRTGRSPPRGSRRFPPSEGASSCGSTTWTTDDVVTAVEETRDPLLIPRLARRSLTRKTSPLSRLADENSPIVRSSDVVPAGRHPARREGCGSSGLSRAEARWRGAGDRRTGRARPGPTRAGRCTRSRRRNAQHSVPSGIAEAHGGGEVEEEVDRSIRLVHEGFDEKTVEAAEEVPVDVAEVVARGVVSVVGELDARPGARRRVSSGESAPCGGP